MAGRIVGRFEIHSINRPVRWAATAAALTAGLISFSGVVPASADTTAWQTNSWQTLTPIPPAGFTDSGIAVPTPNGQLEGHCTSIIGGNIYVAMGYNGKSNGDTNGLRIFNTASQTWTTGPDAPQYKSEGYRGVAHGGKLYCVAGRTKFTPNNSTLSFDPSTGTWNDALAPMPPACGPAASPVPCVGTTAVTFANNIFVFGGRDSGQGPCSGNASNEIYRYDIPSNTWSPVHGTLAVARSDATAARVGRYVYIFFGCNGNGADPTTATYYGSVERFDPRTGQSVLINASATPRANAQAADPQNGSSANASHLIHVTGGWVYPCSFGSECVEPNHLVFDVDQQQFTTPGMDMPRHCVDQGYPDGDRAEHELVYGGDRIYAVGGSCPAYGDSLDCLDMQMLSGTSTASGTGTTPCDPGTASSSTTSSLTTTSSTTTSSSSTTNSMSPPVPSASMVAYSCNANTFPICDTQPLGVSVVLINATGFAPLSTVSLTSSSLGALPAAVADLQGEFVTTYLDTTCNGASETLTGTDSAGNTASVTFACPE